MKILFMFSLACGAMLLSGCKESDAPTNLLPANLEITATISTDGSGLVSFLATADNTLEFKFYFGEGLDEPTLVTADGTTTHTYLSSGTYNVKVLAYSADNRFINKTISIIVQVNELPIPTTGYTTPLTYPGMTLVWNDEFTGNHLNTSYWNYEIGPFNNELQYYKQENTTVQDGYLIIKAKVEKVEGVASSNGVLFQYGVTNKKEINLQPAVNFIGQFLQWQTNIAPENLYED
ncbi:MAG TPA: PKD domain-containing protein, partial [Chryseolinea sp.]|nr:PKD domain-containing protein [Chryseolinea sp.]